MGTLRAAENGLVTVYEARRSAEDRSTIPSRYHENPMGRTNRVRSVRYVRTMAVEVRRTRDEHISPTVEVARQVVAMI
jgi:hypothetical protein